MVTVLNLTKYNMNSNLRAIFGENCNIIDYLNDPKMLSDLDWSKSIPTASLTIGRCAGYWSGILGKDLNYIVLDLPKEDRPGVNEMIANSVSKVVGYNIHCLFADVSINLFADGVEVPASSDNICLPSEESKEEK